MSDYLITGFAGFVSKYFLEYLDNLGHPIHIIGVARTKSEVKKYKNLVVTVEYADLNDRLRVQDILAYYRPKYIVHLASDSSVAYSWKYPINSFQNNTNIFLNLLESVRVINLNCRILSVGSSEEYGIVNKENLPLRLMTRTDSSRFRNILVLF